MFHLHTVTGVPYMLIPSTRSEFGWRVLRKAGAFLVYSAEGFISQHRGQAGAESAVEHAVRCGRENVHVYELTD
jgi:hypothetical protein